MTIFIINDLIAPNNLRLTQIITFLFYTFYWSVSHYSLLLFSSFTVSVFNIFQNLDFELDFILIHNILVLRAGFASYS